MEQESLIITQDLHRDLTTQINRINPDKIFILTDTQTHKLCFPLISEHPLLQEANICTIPAGDDNKSVQSLMFVWKNLSSLGASRKSLLINIGGGMITDLGAFAAATFKRGMSCINIPTTLLSMVDASLGGKTGINFNGLKNEVGAFYDAEAVLIDMQFLKTLDHKNNLSGYAEMLKHGLIYHVKHEQELFHFNFEDGIDYEQLTVLVEESIAVKKHYVSIDPLEKGVRKILNLGHTIGHAFESFALHAKKPVLHGYAVAWGLICELYIAHRQCDFPKEELKEIIELIKNKYGSFYIECKDYEQLFEYMLHDKKNTQGEGIINMPLLKAIGEVSLDEIIKKELILESFDFYRDFMGI